CWRPRAARTELPLHASPRFPYIRWTPPMGGVGPPEADPWLAPGALFLLLTRPRGRAATVPKMKTHKASRKRFRVTATGKLKRRQAGKKHLLSHKTGKRKRSLRGVIIDARKLAKKYVEMMGGHA